MIMLLIYFTLCVVASANDQGEWLNCKPKTGCTIARCDPKPGAFVDAERDGYSILCQPSASVGSESTVLRKKYSQLKLQMAKERNESREMMNEAFKRIQNLERKNGRLEREMKEERKKCGAIMTAALQRISKLEEKNSELQNKMTGGMPTKESIKDEILCPVTYKTKCFLPLSGRHFDHAGGDAVCKNLGGHLANIYSQTHMDDIMKYIREQQLSDFTFRLGMRFDPLVKKLTLRNGSDAADDLKWYPPYPLTGEKYAHLTNVNLAVDKNPSEDDQYLFNSTPGSERYVICET